MAGHNPAAGLEAFWGALIKVVGVNSTDVLFVVVDYLKMGYSKIGFQTTLFANFIKVLNNSTDL